MALRLNPIQYRVGCGLYFLGLVMLASSITIPDFWIHDQENAASFKHHGRSAWAVNVRICLGPKLGPWRCGKIFADSSKLIVAVCFLYLGAVAQLFACFVLLCDNLNNKHIMGRYFSQCLAGLAAQLCVTGILIYTSVTHNAVNIIYAPGFVINVCGIVMVYQGMLLTGLYDDSAPAKTVCDKGQQTMI